MPCPKHAGKHAFHDTRWIATHDAELSYGHDSRDESWGLESGSLVCEMRDGPSENAYLIAAAPDLLAAAIAALTIVNREQPDGSIAADLLKAIRKATKGDE